MIDRSRVLCACIAHLWSRSYVKGSRSVVEEITSICADFRWRTQSGQTGLPAATSLLTGKITGKALEKERWRELNALKS
jgi:hypothetical protein